MIPHESTRSHESARQHASARRALREGRESFQLPQLQQFWGWRATFSIGFWQRTLLFLGMLLLFFYGFVEGALLSAIDLPVELVAPWLNHAWLLGMSTIIASLDPKQQRQLQLWELDLLKENGRWQLIRLAYEELHWVINGVLVLIFSYWGLSLGMHLISESSVLPEFTMLLQALLILVILSALRVTWRLIFKHLRPNRILLVLAAIFLGNILT